MPLFLLSGLIVFSKCLLSHGGHRKVEAMSGKTCPESSSPHPTASVFLSWFLLLHHMMFTAVALNSPTVTVKILPLCLSAHAFIFSPSMLALSFELKSAFFPSFSMSSLFISFYHVFKDYILEELLMCSASNPSPAIHPSTRSIWAS